MSSKIADRGFRTAAWRISAWGAVTFAVGTAVAFLFLQSFLVKDIQRRADAWLVGELGVLADVARRTPNNQLHDVVIEEVAELATREAPRETEGTQALDHTVFFLMTDQNNGLLLHTGAGDPKADIASILRSGVTSKSPSNVALAGFEVPFRVAQADLSNHQHIYLGLSTRYETTILHRLRIQFTSIWLLIILLGGAIVFVTTRQMLQRIRKVSDTAAQIGRDNLTTRVPVSQRRDEITQMAGTFNAMLDRVQSTVQQLHTMADSVAHDVRSPITVIRCKLELALTSASSHDKDEVIASTIEELDRLTNLLSISLDISEGNAHALRLQKQEIDLTEITGSLIDLYEPTFLDAGIAICFEAQGPVTLSADIALLQRLLTNLLENEVRHLPPGASVQISVTATGHTASLRIDDDGPGFPADLLPVIFEPYSRGEHSKGHGLGLAFALAVARSHDGTIIAENKTDKGARIIVTFPSTLNSTHTLTVQ